MTDPHEIIDHEEQAFKDSGAFLWFAALVIAVLLGGCAILLSILL